jgi:hypothetical protein
MTLGLYSQKTAELIHQRVLGDDPDVVHSEGAYDTDYESEWYLAKLTTNLTPATDAETGHTTCTANVTKYTTADTGHAKEEVTDVAEEITITNRDPNIFGAKGDYITVRYVEAEFVPVGPIRTELDAMLTQTLTAATNCLTGSVTATFRVLHPDGGGNLAVTAWNETLTHRYENISLTANTYITVRRLNGEWRLSGADCDVSVATIGAGDASILGTKA